MNGLIFVELRKYVESRLGPRAWDELLDEAGVGARLFVPVTEYPDEELVKLVGAASKRAGRTVPAVLEDFGEFIAPDLIATYSFLIDPRWKTLDLIAQTESTIHEVLRNSPGKVKPPRLECTRPAPGTVVITYASPRRMCGLAKGIAKGVANHFGERVAVTEPVCMSRGASRCEIHVALEK